MNILINTTHPDNKGGVAQFYKDTPNLPGVDFAHNMVGTRQGKSGTLLMFADFVRFLRRIVFNRPDLVILNPSLQTKALARDSVYVTICRIFRLKTFVFFHGWDARVEAKISKSPFFFRNLFWRVAGFFVLASEFEHSLRAWGINAPVLVTRTKADLDNCKAPDKRDFFQPRFLFLSRIEEQKGVMQLIQAFAMVKDRFPGATLEIAGTGGFAGACSDYVAAKGIPDVTFLGYVTGQDKAEAFTRNNAFILPTRHSEGLPTAVVEALAFGLPVVATRKGGLNDILTPENGELLCDTDPNTIRDSLVSLFADPDQCHQISAHNRAYATRELTAEKVWADMFDFMGVPHDKVVGPLSSTDTETQAFARADDS